MQLDLNGTLELTIYKDGFEITPEKEQEVIYLLNEGELFIGLSSGTITDLEYNTVYTFDFEVEDDTEYEYN